MIKPLPMSREVFDVMAAEVDQARQGSIWTENSEKALIEISGCASVDTALKDMIDFCEEPLTAEEIRSLLKPPRRRNYRGLR